MPRRTRSSRPAVFYGRRGRADPPGCVLNLTGAFSCQINTGFVHCTKTVRV
ncbi:lipoprotein [Lysobacter enzymogenes]|uniref:Lipoprotein n=1 Tax=Lysobacter enzymogenes TaxID=69 RepID=A0A0S2DE63_LYSEN|nr:lipoprotein [Lysobacter enzymogenes]